MVNRVNPNRLFPVPSSESVSSPETRETKSDTYLPASSNIPRINFESSESGQAWHTRLAILAGVGLPAVTATLLGASAAMPVEAAAMPTDIASDFLFTEAKAELVSVRTHDVAARDLDSREQELAEKLTRFVEDRFGGDYDAAFAHFDDNGDSFINEAELSEALKDIGVGNFITRGAWVDGIMDKLDHSPRDGKLSHNELIEGVNNPTEST